MSDPLCVNINHTQCYCSNKLEDNDCTLQRRAECLKVMEAVARRKQWSRYKKLCATLETTQSERSVCTPAKALADSRQ